MQTYSTLHSAYLFSAEGNSFPENRMVLDSLALQFWG